MNGCTIVSLTALYYRLKRIYVLRFTIQSAHLVGMLVKLVLMAQLKLRSAAAILF
jgi:hypothetical protein